MTSRKRAIRRFSVPVTLALLLIGSINAPAGGNAPTTLDTMYVEQGETETSTYSLVAGTTYQMVASLTITRTDNDVNGSQSRTEYLDALYCYERIGADTTGTTNVCQTTPPGPSLQAPLTIDVSGGDDRFLRIGHLSDYASTPPYTSDHVYSEVFVAPASSTFKARVYWPSCGASPCYTDPTGSIKVELIGDPAPPPVTPPPPGTPPPPPGTPPPPPGTPPPDGTTLTEPGPGGTLSITSPDPFARTAGVVTVNVNSSAGDLNGSTIVGEGEVSDADKKGYMVASCWLAGPDALIVPPDLKAILSDPDTLRKFHELGAHDAFDVCIGLVNLIHDLEANSGGLRLKAHSTAAEASCGVQRIALQLRRRNGKFTKIAVAKKQRRPASAPKYTCSDTGAGAVAITVTHGRKTSLRDELGKRLDLGVVRAPDAVARDATMTFGFS